METSNRNKAIKYGALALLLLLLGGCFIIINNLKQELAGSKSTVEALSNDIVKHIDKTGAEVSEKKMILSSYKALKSIHASDSSEIGRLKKLVNKNTISGTIISNNTSGHVTGHTEIVFLKDTSARASIPCDTVYPIYKDSVADKWAIVKTIATKDSIRTDYKIFNEYEITQELKKEGNWPFRRKVPTVKVRNLNPHTETTAIASYAVQVPKTGKKTATIAGVAAALAFIAGFLIAK